MLPGNGNSLCLQLFRMVSHLVALAVLKTTTEMKCKIPVALKDFHC